MQTEGTKLAFIVYFSVLDFFKIASRMPHCIDFSLDFQNFPALLEMSSFFFFISSFRLCYNFIHHKEVHVDFVLECCIDSQVEAEDVTDVRGTGVK